MGAINRGRCESHVVYAYLMKTVLLGPFTPSVSVTLRQLCDDNNNAILIENSGVTPEWYCDIFSTDSFVFNENSIASVIAECKRTLMVCSHCPTPRPIQTPTQNGL